MNKRLVIGIITLFSLVNYFPALSTFLSHDDFFWLRVSHASSIADFLGFFNPFTSASGFNFYRPLTSQAYFFVSSLFGNSPFILHLMSLSGFAVLIVVVYKLALELTKNKKEALISTLLYATASANFVKVYWPAIFQEIGVNIFLMLSTLLFLKKRFLLSLAVFVLALMSKESAVVLPGLLVLVSGRHILRQIRLLLIYGLVLAVYLYAHFAHYGVVSGDSYIWDFGPRVVNTLAWYGLWSFNVPESLVDFIGPGIRLNQNLFKFFAVDLIPTTLISITLLGWTLVMGWREKLTKTVFVAFGWFVACLIPVIFLPLHKQSYEIGTALFGVVFLLGVLLKRQSKMFLSLFISLWVVSALLTNYFAFKSHWVFTGAREAKAVNEYLIANQKVVNDKTIVFYDTKQDLSLPWLPSSQLKLDLSNQDFFTVLFPLTKAVYTSDVSEYKDESFIKIPARQFLGY